MTDEMTQSGTGITMLDSLAAEARAYAESAAMNLFQLGRVYTEAKKMVPHGGWQDWIQENGGMSERGAQQVMQLYARFGNNPVFSGVDKSKLLKMLSLPAGTEEDFAAEHDVGNMTSRAVEEAVKREREKAQADLDRERAAREKVEMRAEELASRPPSIPDDIADTLRKKDEDLRTHRAEIDRLSALAQQLMQENKAVGAVHREMEATERLLTEKQAEYDALQAKWLDAESALARGDAERVPADELTADVFASAVRQFIGVCARMPHMARAFEKMGPDTRDTFDSLLQTMESWARDSRTAFRTITAEVIEP